MSNTLKDRHDLEPHPIKRPRKHADRRWLDGYSQVARELYTIPNTNRIHDFLGLRAIINHTITEMVCNKHGISCTSKTAGQLDALLDSVN